MLISKLSFRQILQILHSKTSLLGILKLFFVPLRSSVFLSSHYWNAFFHLALKVKVSSLFTLCLQSAVAAEHGVAADSVSIEGICLKPGSKKGDGFSSDIAAVHFKASFNGEILEKNYIAKYAPEGKRGEMLKMVTFSYMLLHQNHQSHNVLCFV